MSKKIILIALLFVCFTQAQEKKYQSLLWEISGNGLQKKSYVYGSMHVSEKVSYHLSDAFFKHLMEADMIANESDPTTWSDLYNIFSGMYGSNYGYGAFYSNFYITQTKKEDLYPLFRGTNYNLIGLLSRTNEMNKDYQEDTYLDMFIYRTGRKYGKKTLGLEDVKSSTINIMKAEAKVKPKDVEENRQKLKKLLKNKNYSEAMMDYYREKDLDMLDSLTILSSSETYLKAMLYDRNTDMVKSMDSIMKTGSLFAAIGAAHLPGKNGVIEALRAKGYTVTPVFGDYTEEGKKTKKQIEEFFIKPEFETKTTTDGMLSLPLYKLVLENGENFESPDLANGGYINVKRTLLKDFLSKDNKTFNHKSLDSLFYENIPGDILEKKFYNEKNYLVYDIKSKTKTNNAQRYRYYITPLEIIAVIMGGEGEYVRQYETYVFDNIVLKPNENSLEKFVPKKGGFELEVPSYFITHGNKDFEKQYADIKLYAYDDHEKANYILQEQTLGDNDNLEDTEFELKRIHFEFYNQHDLDSTNTAFDKEKMSFTSQSKIGEKDIYLKSTINGSKYYLLGTVGASEEKTAAYFNSFKLKKLDAEVETKVYVDSVAMFSVEIPKKQNEYLDFIFERDYNNYQKKENIFKIKSKAFSFMSPTGKDVELSFYQYHKYDSEKNLDSVWKDFREHIKSDFASNNYDDFADEAVETVESAAIAVEAAVNGDIIPSDLDNESSDKKKKISYNISRWDEELGFNKKDKNKIELINEKLTSNTDKTVHEMNVLAVKPNSNQAIKYKAVFKDGMSYLMKTLVDKNYNNDDAFVEKTFNSFKPFDTLITPSVFENKFKYFVEDAYSENDTIRYSALNSVYFLDITKEDLPQVKEFLEGFEFKQDENETLVALYEKIGQIKDPVVIPYLENIYKKENVTTSIQFAILNALTNQKSKEAYKVIGKLLDYDLPLSDNEYEVTSLFSSFEYDIENSEVLFPDIFQFYSVNEYHTPIIDFTNKLIESNLGNPKKLKSYKKMLLTNAKLEYKRVLSWKQKQDIEENDGYGYYDDGNYAPTGDLTSYLNILYPFKKEKAVAELYAKAEKLDVDNLSIGLAKIQLDKNNEVDKKSIDKLVAKPNTKFVAFQMLHHTKDFEALNKFSEDTIALAALTYFDDLKKDKDSVTFLDKKIITQDKKEIHYFFYKIVDIDEDSYNKNAEKIAGIGFVMEDGKINPQAFKKLRSKTIIEEKEIEPYMKSVIDESINVNHPRATYQKMSDAYNIYGGYEEEYYEE
jgi:uncharacterized protein YbaP (TraB family)